MCCNKNLRIWNTILIFSIFIIATTYIYTITLHPSNVIGESKISTLSHIMNRDNSASVVQLTEEVKQLKAMVNAKNGVFDNIVRLGNVDYPIFVPTIFWKRRFLTIGVLSSASNFDNREAIRETWFKFSESKKKRPVGKYEQVDDDDDLDNDNTWGAFFIVGITGDFAIDSLVREEAEKYQDMIILQVVEKYNAVTRNRHSNRTSFIKSYSVLPYKTHAFVQLSVSLSSISGFIMKTDDDCFVDIPKVLDLLHEQEERKNLYMGRCYSAKPERDPSKRWYVSKESFPDESYPTYCRGTGYFLSLDVAIAIASTVRNSKHLKWYFEMEDISVALQLGQSSKSEDVTPIDLGYRKIAGHGVNGYLFKECYVCHTTRESKGNLQPLMEKLWKDRKV